MWIRFYFLIQSYLLPSVRVNRFTGKIDLQVGCHSHGAKREVLHLKIELNMNSLQHEYEASDRTI